VEKLPVYRVRFDPNGQTGLDLISIVDRPAIEANFIRLEKAPIKVKLAAEKQYVTGPVLIPDKQIYRNDGGHEYLMYFTAEDIELYRNDFFQNGKTKLSNLDHASGKTIEAILIESWIVMEPETDKSWTLGFEGVVPGTLFATYYIPDRADWEAVSKRNGFSIEASVNMVPVQMSQQTMSDFDKWVEELTDEIIAEMGQ